MSLSKAPFSRPPACQPPPTSPQGRIRVGARWEELLGTTPDSGTGPAPALVWFGHRGLDAAVLGAVADVRAIVCCDWGDELREVSKALPVVSVEKETGRRAVWSSGSLASISSDRVREAIRVAAASEGPALVAPYRTTSACEGAAEALPRGQVTLVGAPSRVVDRLDDKLLQRPLFERWGLPMPAWSVAGPEDLRMAHRRVGGVTLPAIVQVPRSSLGRQTYLLASPDDVPQLLALLGTATDVLVSEYIAGPIINTTAVITADEVHLAWPSIQMAGLRSCAPHDCPFAYCGNDFSAASDLPQEALELLFTLKRRLGDGLRGEGYLGLFGADWIYDGKDLYLLEVNPRFQGSTLLLAALEARAGIPTVGAEHLRAFLGQAAIPAAGKRPARPQPLPGANVVLYQRRPDVVVTGRSSAAPGASLTRQDPSAHPGAGPEWILTGAPAPGTEVAAGAILGRLLAPHRVVDASLEALTPEATEAVSLAYRALRVYDS